MQYRFFRFLSQPAPAPTAVSIHSICRSVGTHTLRRSLFPLVPHANGRILNALIAQWG